jgi:translocation and assembly module TamB
MTRRKRIALISAGTVILLLLIAVVAGTIMVQSGWLREKIRERVVAEAEKATGGKVEIGALRLDWKTLTAEIDNLIIHGTEPADAAPLLAVRRVTIGFKILSFLERKFNVALVEAEGPRAHVIIEADGSTNLPHPKIPNGKTGPETILALKIGKFDLANGLVAVERAGGQKDAAPSLVTPWNARGENLTAHATYNSTGPRYEGAISVGAVAFTWKGLGTSGVQVTAAGRMEKDQLTVSTATVKSAQSEVDLSNLVVSGFNAPLTTGQYKARLSLAEADRIFKFVNFQHTGVMNASGTFHFVSMTDYLVEGAVRGSGIGYGNVRDMRVSGNVSATRDKVALSGFRANALGGEMRADGEVRKLSDFHLAGQLENLDSRLLAGLGGVAALPYDGIVSGPFDATGKLEESAFHRIVASATLEVSPAANSLPVHGEVTATYNGEAGTVELARSWLELPNTRVDLAGVIGQRLDVKVQSRDLNDLSPVVNLARFPAKLTARTGSVAFNGTVSGALADPRIAGHATVQNATYNKQQIDSLAGDFTAMKTLVTVTNASLVSNNLRARITGSMGLSGWKAVTTSAVDANVQLINADVGKLLAMANQSRLPVSGTLNTTAQVTGTIGDPHATADLTLAKGQIYGEPYDSVTGRAQYLNSGAQLLTAVVDAGKKRLNASARFDHPDRLTFNVSSNAMALGEIAYAQKIEPGLRGTAQVKTDGVIRFGQRLDILDLNADIRTTGLTLGVRALGDAHLTAETKSGLITAKFDSNVAKSAIHGDGTVTLTGDYPVNAKLIFSNLGLSAVAAAMRGPTEDKDLNLDGSAAGEMTLNGSAGKPDLINASIDVTQFELHPLTITGDARNIPNLALRNNGPIRATLSKSVVRIDSARFQAPETDLVLTGAVALNSASPFDLQLQGKVNLALAETYNADLTSSGELAINAAVRGSYTNPSVSGRAELQKGDFHYLDFSNGLTNANGVILFSEKQAIIQSFTAESGGGKANVTGFATLNDAAPPTFRIEARTQGVRVRYPAGVSTTSDATITLAGTSARSQASGTVTVRRVAINPKSDVSNILEAAAQPMKTAAGSAGFLGNMNLDVQIETAPDVAFETSVAQSLEADANLRLRGTAANPAVLGRINVTQGELAFFGNKYTINQGSISFFNPAKIDPILNVDLETKARGVEVTITVTGPINNLHASYRSDPPLQFADIVALLATGRSPMDSTLASANTGQSQSLQQLGASALVGQAISNPVGGPLQRFFGVSKVKIDPQLTGITGSPEARLTIEQQVSPDILFTYIDDVSSTSTQLIRVEWDFNRRWAAIVTREQNGYVGVEFAFKKRFK